MSAMRIAVLASGSGSNLQAIMDHLARGDHEAGRIVWVGSNRADAGALVRAQSAGIATGVIDAHADGAAMLAMLHACSAELLVLAGYLKLVPVEVVRAFHGRMLNVHPALLPAFGGTGMYGARVHEAVIASGALVSGVTVHFVDEHYDRGAIIAQWPVPVRPGDSPATLAARVLSVEHRLFPRCVEWVSTGRVTLGTDGRRRVVAPNTHGRDAQVPSSHDSPIHDDDASAMLRFALVPDAIKADPIDADPIDAGAGIVSSAGLDREFDLLLLP
jgi:phosphoribosylglycinamide formyltransferase 1